MDAKVGIVEMLNQRLADRLRKARWSLEEGGTEQEVWLTLAREARAALAEEQVFVQPVHDASFSALSAEHEAIRKMGPLRTPEAVRVDVREDGLVGIHTWGQLVRIAGYPTTPEDLKKHLLAIGFKEIEI